MLRYAGQEHQIYSFDGFKLDMTRGALFRGNVELKLRPKSFDVLNILPKQGKAHH